MYVSKHQALVVCLPRYGYNAYILALVFCVSVFVDVPLVLPTCIAGSFSIYILELGEELISIFSPKKVLQYIAICFICVYRRLNLPSS